MQSPSIRYLSLTTLALICAHADLSLAQSSTESAAPAELSPIVVTASKRDQTLDSVNGAAYVVPAQALRDAQVENTMQLGRVLPGVQFEQSGSFLFPVVSVRGITSAQDYYNPALTVYVDGVPQLPTFAAQQLVDVDRVELLKGPQSTLYGKSAQGGVLNIISRQPDNDPHFRASAGVFSRDGYQLKAAASGPLVKDMLYGSVAGVVGDAPGQLNNPVTGADGVGGSRSNAGAARLRLAPRGEPWELGLSVSGECTRASQDAYVPFNDIDSREAAITAGMPADKSDFYQRRCGSSQALTGHYDFDGWRLSAMAAWQSLNISREYPIFYYDSQQPEHWRQQVQELRLSTTGKHTVDATFGLYRQRVNQSRDYINDMYYASMSMNALTTQSRNETESLAAFGDLTWHATETLDLSAGLRYSHDKASTSFNGRSLNSSYSYDTFAGQDSTNGNTVLGHLSAGYDLTDAWRIYANVAQGYKPGGYNLAPSSAADAEAFGKEESVSYEIGTRYTGDTLRLGAAVYWIETRDAQLYVSNNIGYQHIQNVGKTRSTGVEFDAAWDVTPHWTLGLEGAYTHAVFRDLEPGVCAGCSDNRVPFSPTYMLTARAQGNFHTSAGTVRPMLAVRRTGSQYFDVANSLRQDAYTLVDLGVTWQPRTGLDITAYVNNLADKRYRTYGFSGGSLGDYAQVGTGRTVGLTVAYEY